MWTTIPVDLYYRAALGAISTEVAEEHLQEVEAVDIDGTVFVRHLPNDYKLSTILE